MRVIVLIRACARLRWFLKFSSVIACYIVFFAFYINNLGNWSTFIAIENLPGRINNFSALSDSIKSFLIIPCPTSFLTTKRRSQRARQSSRGGTHTFFSRLNESIVVVSLRAKLSVGDYNIFKIFFEKVFTKFNYTLLINMPRVAQIEAFTLREIFLPSDSDFITCFFIFNYSFKEIPRLRRR